MYVCMHACHHPGQAGGASFTVPCVSVLFYVSLIYCCFQTIQRLSAGMLYEVGVLNNSMLRV